MVMRYTDQDRARDYVQRKTRNAREERLTGAEAREMGFTGASQNVIDALNEFKVVSDRDYQKVVEASKDRRRRIIERIVPHFLRDRNARRGLLIGAGILATGALTVSTAAGIVSGHNLAFGFPYLIKQIQSLANQIGETGAYGEAKGQVEIGGKFVTGKIEAGVGEIQDQYESAKKQLRDVGLLQSKEPATVEEARQRIKEDQSKAMGVDGLLFHKQDNLARGVGIDQENEQYLGLVKIDPIEFHSGEGEPFVVSDMRELAQLAINDPGSKLDEQARKILSDHSYNINVKESLDAGYNPNTVLSSLGHGSEEVFDNRPFQGELDILNNMGQPDRTGGQASAYYHPNIEAQKILNERGVTEDGPFVKALSPILGPGAGRVAGTLRGWLTPLFGAKYLADEKQVPSTVGKFSNVAVPATVGLAGLVAANQANKIAGDVRHVINPESSVGPLKRIDDRAMLRAATTSPDQPTRDRARLAFTNNQRRADYLAKTAGYLAA